MDWSDARLLLQGFCQKDWETLSVAHQVQKKGRHHQRAVCKTDIYERSIYAEAHLPLISMPI